MITRNHARPWSGSVRKGDRLIRKSDGYVFEVKDASKRLKGAHLQAVDARGIFDWYWFREIASGFVRVRS